MTIVLTSGGFDPLHAGHIRLFQEAANLGHHLIVLINSDEWLKRKKGRVFMNQEERKEIIQSIRGVGKTIIYESDADHIAGAIKKYKPNIFAKGGDRNSSNLPPEEVEACKKVDCQIIYGVGGDKIQSSSWLLKSWEKK